MRVTDLQPNQYISRVHYDGRKWGHSKGLTIKLNEHRVPCYYVNGEFEAVLKLNSSAYNYRDFYISDKLGNKLNLEEVIMKYEETTVVVLRETNGALVPFKSDEEAQIWIAKELEKDSTQKFKVWDKPSYEVRPKKVDLSELIHKF